MQALSILTSLNTLLKAVICLLAVVIYRFTSFTLDRDIVNFISWEILDLTEIFKYFFHVLIFQKLLFILLYVHILSFLIMLRCYIWCLCYILLDYW